MKYKIPIFSREISDGVAETIQANASIAYCVQAEVFTPSAAWMTKVLAHNQSTASLTDSDLYPVKSILASTNWNKNDDVFSPSEMWMARSTPIHKPDNMNHDEKVIIGHMIDCWAIDESGNIIAEDTPIDKLPTYFHLVNNSVIYTTWSDEKFKEDIMSLIAKIEAGEAFVSMECIFKGFDYALITPNGENKVLSRNEETSFLTKHLKAYGGTGDYENYRIGRIMRNMTFVGKGYVDKPANPESIVFSPQSATKFTASEEINTFFENKGVLISCKANLTDKQEISDMSEGTNKVLEDQVAELKATVKSLTEKNDILAQSASQATVETIKSENKTLSDKFATVASVLETTKAELLTVQAEKEAALKSADDLSKAKATVMEELQKMQAEILKATRLNSLIAGGVNEVEAKATVEKFAYLTDDQFASIAELTIKAAKPAFLEKKDDKKEDKKDDKAKCSDSNTAASVDLDTPEVTEDVTLATTTAPDDNGMVEMRKQLASWAESLFDNSSNK